MFGPSHTKGDQSHRANADKARWAEHPGSVRIEFRGPDGPRHIYHSLLFATETNSSPDRRTRDYHPPRGENEGIDDVRIAFKGFAKASHIRVQVERGAVAAKRQGVSPREDRMTEAGLAIFVLAAFVIPVPLLSWLDRKPRKQG
jgi:hypothetical protein